MKSTYFIFILAVSAIACQHQPEEHSLNFPSIPGTTLDVNDSGLSRNLSGDLFYYTSLFSGYVVEFFDNGEVRSKTPYFQGKMNGTYVGYYPNGGREFERPYLDGKKVGEHQGWYDNGRKKFEFNFEEGLSVGTHFKWYKDGSKYMKQNFASGYEYGKQQVWRPDGKLRSNYIVREDGRKYGLLGIKRCTKLDSETQEVEPYTGEE